VYIAVPTTPRNRPLIEARCERKLKIKVVSTMSRIINNGPKKPKSTRKKPMIISFKGCVCPIENLHL
jgi:hypothetical protein